MNEAQASRPIRILMLLGLLLAAVFISCEPFGPSECDFGSDPVQGRIVQFDVTKKAIVPVSNAEIRFVSIQTVFECRGGRNAEPLLLITDEQGNFDGFLEAYEDDLFEITITAEGCELLVIKPATRGTFRGGGDFPIICEEEE